VCSNGTGVNTNRLFSLFAQNRGHHNENGSLRLDWNVFCSDLHHSAHDSTWQRLSQHIIKRHRSKLQNYVPISKPLFNDKFKRSFKVAIALTVRSLTIKGVSPATIAKTQMSLYQHQLKNSMPDFKDHQMTCPWQDLCLLPNTFETQLSLFAPKASQTFIIREKMQETISLLRSRRRQRVYLPSTVAAMQLHPLAQKAFPLAVFPELYCGYSGLHLPCVTLFSSGPSLSKHALKRWDSRPPTISFVPINNLISQDEALYTTARRVKKNATTFGCIDLG
jgi:hypothetical protein